MKAEIYTRVSTEEQVSNFSLDQQEKACLNFIKNKGWELDKVFREEGESGTWFNRTQLQNLLEHCRRTKKEEKVMVVYSIDRFARDVGVHFTIKALLKKYNVSLFSVTQPIDNTAEGNLMETIFAGTSEYENKLRGRRTKDGLRKRFESGYWCWGAPLGYRNIKTADGKKIIEPDQAVASFITFAFNEYAKGIYSKVQIGQKLYRRGLRTKKGKKVSPQTLDVILRNKFYAGVMVSKKLGIEKEGLYKPLIDISTFRKVQLVIQGKSVSAVPRNKCNPEYPLRGFVKCPACGNSLTASQSKGNGGEYQYYHCYQKPRDGRSFPKETLEKEFRGYLKTITPKEARIKLFRAVVAGLWESKKRESGTDINKFKEMIAVLEEGRRKTIDLLREEVIPKETGKKELLEIQEQIETLSSEMTELNQDSFNVRTAAEKCAEALKNSAVFWQTLKTVEQKQTFQKLIFPQGVIYQNPGFRTNEMGLLFQSIPALTGEKTSLVTPLGFEPRLTG